ncbi:hypothetical protein, partial [Escherichia coli]
PLGVQLFGVVAVDTLTNLHIEPRFQAVAGIHEEGLKPLRCSDNIKTEKQDQIKIKHRFMFCDVGWLIYALVRRPFFFMGC